MTSSAETLSGKGRGDENFPVASRLIGAAYRGPILAFYRFARAADDVADHPSLAAEQKLALLDRLGEALDGRGPGDPEAEPLRLALVERGLTSRHPHELLEAFRLDATKRRYASWRELMDYCRLSAAPVGRFVLDVHGEDPGAWRSSDPLCAALQVINHLQDCAADYRRLDRVYLPQDTLAARGASVEMLGAARSPPPCWAPSGRSQRAPRRCSWIRPRFPGRSRTGGWRWKSRRSRRWRSISPVVWRAAIR